jgi:ArsR family transcriptional regulator
MRELSQWFKALSEDLRLQILALMFRHGELCVCEVERFLEVSQSTASRHLRYLLNADIVEDRRDGLWVYYRIADPPDEAHAALLEALEGALAEVPVPDVATELDAMRSARCGPANMTTAGWGGPGSAADGTERELE